MIQHLTHDFMRLVNLVKSCNGQCSYTSRVHLLIAFFQPVSKLLSSARLPRLWGQTTFELYQYLYSLSRCSERTVILMSFERRTQVCTKKCFPLVLISCSSCRTCSGNQRYLPGQYVHFWGNRVILIDIQGPIIEHIYNSLLQLYEKYDASTLQGRILQCLGTSYHL